MKKRLARSTGEWASTPIDEICSERQSTQTLTYEVIDLDERFEYMFYVAARWTDVPASLGTQNWTHEVASVVLPSRLPELRAPRPPLAEICASDSEGISMQVRWYPSAALRDGSNLPIPDSRFQVRWAQVPHGALLELAENLHWDWKEHLPVLENSAAPSGHEVVYRVRDLVPGCSYIFSVRHGDNHRWSSWSSPSEPVVLGLTAPIPSPGDVLEISCDTGASSTIRLEWRPFRAAMNLACVEYKVMCLEWPFHENPRDSQGGGVLARLRRAAHESQAGLAGDASGTRSFHAAGYVATQTSSEGPLRATGDRVEWRTEGLRPGRYYRFFVCARYVCLPFGATLPPACASSDPTEPKALMWPDEHCERIRADGVAWEAALSRCGLWSPVVNTGHVPQYHAIPSLQMSASASPGIVPPLSQPQSPMLPFGRGELQMSGPVPTIPSQQVQLPRDDMEMWGEEGC